MLSRNIAQLEYFDIFYRLTFKNIHCGLFMSSELYLYFILF